MVLLSVLAYIYIWYVEEQCKYWAVSKRGGSERNACMREKASARCRIYIYSIMGCTFLLSSPLHFTPTLIQIYIYIYYHFFYIIQPIHNMPKSFCNFSHIYHLKYVNLTHHYIYLPSKHLPLICLPSSNYSINIFILLAYIYKLFKI